MTNQRNETPEPLAGATVESCISALVSALQRDKGWLHDYADSVVRDAIERKHLEPLAFPAHPEPHSHTWTEQEKRCILAWGAELVSTKAAALQAKDAEIARLKAVLRDREARLFEARKLLDERPAINAGLFEAYSKWTGKVYSLDWLNAVDAAAIRAQTGGEG